MLSSKLSDYKFYPLPLLNSYDVYNISKAKEQKKLLELAEFFNPNNLNLQGDIKEFVIFKLQEKLLLTAADAKRMLTRLLYLYLQFQSNLLCILEQVIDPLELYTYHKTSYDAYIDKHTGEIILGLKISDSQGQELAESFCRLYYHPDRALNLDKIELAVKSHWLTPKQLQALEYFTGKALDVPQLMTYLVPADNSLVNHENNGRQRKYAKFMKGSGYGLLLACAGALLLITIFQAQFFAISISFILIGMLSAYIMIGKADAILNEIEQKTAAETATDSQAVEISCLTTPANKQLAQATSRIHNHPAPKLKPSHTISLFQPLSNLNSYKASERCNATPSIKN